MKKIIRSLSALVLVFAMAVCLVPADANAMVSVSNAKQQTASSAYGSMMIKGDANDVFGNQFSYGGNACLINMRYSYSTTPQYMISESSYSAYYGRIIPITVNKKGLLVLSMNGDSVNSGASYVEHELFYDAACTMSVRWLSGPSMGQNKRSEVRLPQAGTYYLRVQTSYGISKDSVGGTDTVTTGFIFYADAPTKTLKNGVSFETYLTYEDSTPWFTYKATADGYITLEYEDDEMYDRSGAVTLYNSKKKALSDQIWFNADTTAAKRTVFGVKKGQTYYFKVEYVNTGFFAMKCTQTAIKEKSGSARKKAVTLKKNKAVKGVMTAGDNKADWYKIKLPKSKVLKLITTGCASGEFGAFDITLYYSNGKKYASPATCIKGIDSKYTNKTVEMWTGKPLKLKKGTYYVKISKAKKTASGFYTLKWK